MIRIVKQKYIFCAPNRCIFETVVLYYLLSQEGEKRVANLIAHYRSSVLPAPDSFSYFIIPNEYHIIKHKTQDLALSFCVDVVHIVDNCKVNPFRKSLQRTPFFPLRLPSAPVLLLRSNVLADSESDTVS